MSLVKDTRVPLLLPEGSQLCVGEGKELSFGKLAAAPILPTVLWKTAPRDWLHRSVSVGLNTFAKLRIKAGLRLKLVVQAQEQLHPHLLNVPSSPGVYIRKEPS